MTSAKTSKIMIRIASGCKAMAFSSALFSLQVGRSTSLYYGFHSTLGCCIVWLATVPENLDYNVVCPRFNKKYVDLSKMPNPRQYLYLFITFDPQEKLRMLAFHPSGFPRPGQLDEYVSDYSDFSDDVYSTKVLFADKRCLIVTKN